MGRLAEFKRSVEDALRRSSSAYHILRQLEESGLKDCARCTRELEAKLAGNPHYLVLSKIAEAEKLVSELAVVRSVMIEKSATSRWARFESGLLDLNHTGIKIF